MEARVFNGVGELKKGCRGKWIYDKELKKVVRYEEPEFQSGVTIIPDIQEFITEDISGVKEKVTGRRTEKRLMKQHGVRHFESTEKDVRDVHREKAECDIRKLKAEGRWNERELSSEWGG